jgi:hypothetical protein
MKKFLSFLVMLPLVVFATDDVHECKNDYDLALSVMQQRQKDNNLIEAMQLFTDKKLVMSAYSQPQQKTIRLRIEATKNFANHSAQKCFKWSNSKGDEAARIDDTGISLRIENKSWLKTKVANWIGVKYL